MLIISLIILLLSNSITLRRDKSILCSRATITILLISAFIAYDNLFFLFLNKGTGIFSGLFNTTATTIVFHIFIFLVSSHIATFCIFPSFHRHDYPKPHAFANIPLHSALNGAAHRSGVYSNWRANRDRMSINEQIQHLQAELDRERDMARDEPNRSPWLAFRAEQELRELREIRAQVPPVQHVSQVDLWGHGQVDPRYQGQQASQQMQPFQQNTQPVQSVHGQVDPRYQGQLAYQQIPELHPTPPQTYQQIPQPQPQETTQAVQASQQMQPFQQNTQPVQSVHGQVDPRYQGQLAYQQIPELHPTPPQTYQQIPQPQPQETTQAVQASQQTQQVQQTSQQTSHPSGWTPVNHYTSRPDLSFLLPCIRLNVFSSFKSMLVYLTPLFLGNISLLLSALAIKYIFLINSVGWPFSLLLWIIFFGVKLLLMIRRAVKSAAIYDRLFNFSANQYSSGIVYLIIFLLSILLVYWSA